MQKAEDEELLDSVVGLYFHTLDENGYVINQGRIIGKEGELYIIQLFEWLTGLESVIQIRKQSDFLSSNKINLYKTSEDMNYWYKYKARKDVA